MQASLPRFFSGFFFSVLRTLAELRSADCRFGNWYASSAILLRQNERVRERQLRLARSFRRSETAIPRGR